MVFISSLLDRSGIIELEWKMRELRGIANNIKNLVNIEWIGSLKSLNKLYLKGNELKGMERGENREIKITGTNYLH